MKYSMDQITQKAIKKFPHRAVDIAQSFDIKQIKSTLKTHVEGFKEQQ